MPSLDTEIVYCSIVALSQKILKDLTRWLTGNSIVNVRAKLLELVSVAQREALSLVFPSIALSAVNDVPLSKLLAVAFPSRL